jgi:hypothetical protein
MKSSMSILAGMARLQVMRFMRSISWTCSTYCDYFAFPSWKKPIIGAIGVRFKIA